MSTGHAAGAPASLPILVVGAGIAGLTAAAALGRVGFAVELAERRAEVTDGGGVGLTVTGNAMRALDRIGVAEACVAAGMPMDSILLCDATGEPLRHNPMPPTGGERWPRGTGIARPAFHDILLAAALETATLRCGESVQEWVEDDDAIEVTFADGTAGRYALLVAADGIYSAIRRRLFPESGPAPTGQSVWRAEIARPDEVDVTRLFLGGRHGAVGICPVSPGKAYMYIVEGADPALRRDPATLHQQMRDELAGYGGLVADLRDQLVDPRTVSYRPIEWLLAPAPWSAGRVVLIGDAAHANPPVLAQGAAMGIEDAVVLADELAASPADIPAALGRYHARRRERAAYVVETSCRLAQWEVEHARDVDVPGVMREAAIRMAQPI